MQGNDASAIRQQVEAIATDITKQGSVQARALLTFALDYVYPIRLEIPVAGSAKTGDPDNTGDKEVAEEKEEQPIINNKPLTINVYPNPSSGQITLEAYLPAGTATANIAIYNMLGERVKDFALTTGNNHIIIHAGELSEGVYLYLLETDGVVLHKDKLAIIK